MSATQANLSAQFKLLAGNLGDVTDATGKIVQTHRDGTASQALFFYPREGLAQQANGDLWVCDSGNHVLRRITPAGVVDTYGHPSKNGGARSGSKLTAQFQNPIGLAIGRQDGDEVMFVADAGGAQIWRINLSHMGEVESLGQSVSTFGLRATPLDGLLSTATFPCPEKLCPQYQSDGSLVLWEATGDGRLRKITSTAVHTVAHQERQYVYGMVTRSDGAVLVATDCAIYSYFDGVYSLFAGSPQELGGVDGWGLQARFQTIKGMAIDAQDNLYVSNESGLRKITPQGQVSTVLYAQDWAQLLGAANAQHRLSALLMTGPQTMAVTAGNAVGILTLP